MGITGKRVLPLESLMADVNENPQAAPAAAPETSAPAVTPVSDSGDKVLTKAELLALSPDKRRQVLRELADQEYTETADETSTPAEAETPKQEGSASVPSTDVLPEKPADEGKPPPDKRDWKYWKEKHQKDADELNKAKQRLEWFEKREAERKELEEKIKDLKVEKDDGFLDDDHQKSIASTIKRLELQVTTLSKQLQERDAREVEEIRPKAKEAEASSDFALLAELQERAPELQTSKPFHEADQDAERFLNSVTVQAFPNQDFRNLTPDQVGNLRAQAHKRYAEDAAFRSQVEAAGVKTPEDFEKTLRIREIWHFKQKEGHRSLRAAYRDWQEINGISPTPAPAMERKQAELEGAARTVAHLQRAQEAATTLSPSDGAAPDILGGGMTPQMARDRLNALRSKSANIGPLTVSEKKEMRSLIEKLSG